MRLISIGLVLWVVGFSYACTHAPSQLDVDLSDSLPADSCAISCPANTAYSGLRGSVGCAEGFAPICQCVVRSRPMAACEAVPQAAVAQVPAP
jgi:hypothetical protein